jgi:flagellin-like protein
MKNSKAISPIFATLILIAIAVIAGVVVYMFTSGTLATMTAGGTAGQEKVTVQAASIVFATSGQTKVYLEQTGGPAATVNSLIIKDSSGNTVGVISGTNAFGSSVSTVTLVSGTLTTLTSTTPTTGLTLGSSYTITVTTAAGGSFVSPSVVATAS